MDSIFLLHHRTSLCGVISIENEHSGCVGRGRKERDCYGRANCALGAWINPYKFVRTVFVSLSKMYREGTENLASADRNGVSATSRILKDVMSPVQSDGGVAGKADNENPELG